MFLDKKDSTFFANRIKNYRKKLGMTQKDVADLLRIERSTYAFYETGKTTPGLDTLYNMAQVFGVAVDQLLSNGPEVAPTVSFCSSDSIPYKVSAEPQPIQAPSPEEMAMILSFRQMPPEQKQKVLSLLSETEQISLYNKE